MIERRHDLALSRQAALLDVGRSGLYYEPRPVPPSELVIMRRIDELHLDYPFAGARMRRDLLRGEGVTIGRALVTTMMRRMGEACQGPAGRSADGWQAEGSRRSTAGRIRPSLCQDTRFIHTCCAIW